MDLASKAFEQARISHPEYAPTWEGGNSVDNSCFGGYRFFIFVFRLCIASAQFSLDPSVSLSISTSISLQIYFSVNVSYLPCTSPRIDTRKLLQLTQTPALARTLIFASIMCCVMVMATCCRNGCPVCAERATQCCRAIRLCGAVALQRQFPVRVHGCLDREDSNARRIGFCRS